MSPQNCNHRLKIVVQLVGGRSCRQRYSTFVIRKTRRQLLSRSIRRRSLPICCRLYSNSKVCNPCVDTALPDIFTGLGLAFTDAAHSRRIWCQRELGLPSTSTQHDTISFIGHQIPIKRTTPDIAVCLDLYQIVYSRRSCAPPSHEFQPCENHYEHLRWSPPPKTNR